MPGGIAQQIQACKECGHSEIPNFKLETRLAYHQNGVPGQIGSYRSVLKQQECLVCLKCGAVNEIRNEAR